MVDYPLISNEMDHGASFGITEARLILLFSYFRHCNNKLLPGEMTVLILFLLG